MAPDMQPDRHQTALADLAACIDDLDGFPIRPLIHEYLATPAGDGPARERLAAMVDHALC